MLYYPFKDYDEFKKLFGFVEHGNGKKSRRNKILLAHYKSPKLLAYVRHIRNRGASSTSEVHLYYDVPRLLTAKNMGELKSVALDLYKDMMPPFDYSLPNMIINCLVFPFARLHSVRYGLSNGGYCFDGDKTAVRYVSVKNGKVYKMKAGRFFSAVLGEYGLSDILAPEFVHWLSQELADAWKAECKGRNDGMTLHVDDNFNKIYSSAYCSHFGSCMQDTGNYTFYENAVDAKAAYLEDKDGQVLARAIIFNAWDENGEIWRLCERQYSREGNDDLKRVLVNRLIDGGYIDGYKRVGASCHDGRAFNANDGTALDDHRFTIDCDLDDGDRLSYQDSFKFYNFDDHKASNDSNFPHDYELDTTDSYFGNSECYDEYHDRYCEETRTCYYRGNAIQVDVDDMDDFVWVDSENEYYHMDDVVVCEECGECVADDNAYYDEDTERYFCDEDCAASYKSSHGWEYDDYAEQWIDIDSFGIDMLQVHVFLANGDDVDYTMTEDSVWQYAREEGGRVDYNGDSLYDCIIDCRPETEPEEETVEETTDNE